jgi:glutamate racemase
MSSAKLMGMQNKINASALPIGVFDSGVGGISVLKHIRDLMPHENLIYVADSRHAPYGNQTPEFIQERSFWLAEFLLRQGVKALVVACNTATAAAVAGLRERYPDLTIIGMEPAVKPAVAATKTRVVGVLATSGTLKSAQFAALLEHYGQGVEVVTQACVGLVECVEKGALTSSSTKALLKQYVQPLLDAKADTIVLGCTHYPFVRTLIEELVGKDVVLIDTGAAVAKHLKNRLQENQLLRASDEVGGVSFWSNNERADTQGVISALWGDQVSVAHLI